MLQEMERLKAGGADQQQSINWELPEEKFKAKANADTDDEVAKDAP